MKKTILLFLLSFLLSLAGSVYATPPPQGFGCTTLYFVDIDCDFYGSGTGLLGADADPFDPEVNTPESVVAKHGSIESFLIKKGIVPTGSGKWIFVAPGEENHKGSESSDFSVAMADPYTGDWYRQSASNTVYKAISPGDVVVVRGGIYTNLEMMFGWKRGTEANPIHIIANVTYVNRNVT